MVEHEEGGQRSERGKAIALGRALRSLDLFIPYRILRCVVTVQKSIYFISTGQREKREAPFKEYKYCDSQRNTHIRDRFNRDVGSQQIQASMRGTRAQGGA